MPEAGIPSTGQAVEITDPQIKKNRTSTNTHINIHLERSSTHLRALSCLHCRSERETPEAEDFRLGRRAPRPRH